MIVRSEVIHLWLPEVLVDPARREFPALVARTHQELKKALERRGQEDLSYAITVRGHQANHGAADISFIRYPYREPENLQELIDVLAKHSRRELLPAILLRTTPQPSSTSCPRGCHNENGSMPSKHRRFLARLYHMSRS